MVFQIVFWFLIYAIAFNVMCFNRKDKIMFLEYTGVLVAVVVLLKGLEVIGRLDVMLGL